MKKTLYQVNYVIRLKIRGRDDWNTVIFERQWSTHYKYGEMPTNEVSKEYTSFTDLINDSYDYDGSSRFTLLNCVSSVISRGRKEKDNKVVINIHPSKYWGRPQKIVVTKSNFISYEEVSEYEDLLVGEPRPIFNDFMLRDIPNGDLYAFANLDKNATIWLGNTFFMESVLACQNIKENNTNETD